LERSAHRGPGTSFVWGWGRFRGGIKKAGWPQRTLGGLLRDVIMVKLGPVKEVFESKDGRVRALKKKHMAGSLK